MKKIFAFTLVEIMFAMAIVGVISAIAASGLKNVMPDENRIRFQKCYGKMTEAVEALHNDEVNYPKIPYMSGGNPVTVNGETKLYGFANKYYLDPSNVNQVMPTAKNNKFSYLFSQEFAISQLTSPGYTTRFTAKDLSYWHITDVYMAIDGKNYSTITFDVDGLTKGTNCPVTGVTFTTNIPNCTKPDTFRFLVYSNASIKEVDTLGTFNQKSFLSSNNYYGNEVKY